MNQWASVKNTTGQYTARGSGVGGLSIGEVVEPVEQYPMVFVRPRSYIDIEEELHATDPKLHELAPVDQKLIKKFGDTIHQNDGTHSTRGSCSEYGCKLAKLVEKGSCRAVESLLPAARKGC